MSAVRKARAAQIAATIRPARFDDLDALVALEHAAFASDRATRRALRHAIRSPSMSLFAAVISDSTVEVLVGAATLERRSGSRVARLSSIAIAPSRAGQGLGGRLLDAMEAEAYAQGCTWMRLEARTDNGGAIRLYERRDYVRYAVKPGYYEDGATAWGYEKRLRAP